MILEKLILKDSASFIDEDGQKFVFTSGARFGCEADAEGNIYYISDEGKRYISNTPLLPIKITNQVRLTKPTLFYVIDHKTKAIKETKYIQADVVFNKEDNGYYTCTNLSICDNEILLKCDNEENFEPCFLFPATEAKAEAEDKTENKAFELNPNAKYCGQDGIDAVILYLQTADLSKLIVRDDNTHTLFVDLGSADMWTDIDNPDWIMKLNARIPLKSACSVGKRFVKGKPRLAVILNASFV